MEEDLARVGPILQRYAELTSRPSVSFAQDSVSPLPVRDFLSQLECDGDAIKVVQGPQGDSSPLGETRNLSLSLFLTHTPHTYTFCLGAFVSGGIVVHTLYVDSDNCVCVCVCVCV